MIMSLQTDRLGVNRGCGNIQNGISSDSWIYYSKIGREIVREIYHEINLNATSENQDEYIDIEVFDKTGDYKV